LTWKKNYGSNFFYFSVEVKDQDLLIKYIRWISNSETNGSFWKLDLDLFVIEFITGFIKKYHKVRYTVSVRQFRFQALYYNTPHPDSKLISEGYGNGSLTCFQDRYRRTIHVKTVLASSFVQFDLFSYGLHSFSNITLFFVMK
jgi:hypothetical protein